MLASKEKEETKNQKKQQFLCLKFKSLFANLLKKENSRKGDPRHCLSEAHSLFKEFKYLFKNLILNKNDWIYCYNIIVRQETAEEAFKLVAIELGFLYDVLYTKATLLHNCKVGIVLRCSIFSASVTGLIVFPFFMDAHGYHDTTDVIVTYLLLGGAVFLELLAFVNFLRSDWTKLRLVKCRQLLISPCALNRKRWSGYMAQYNLVDSCLKENESTLPYYVKKLPAFGKKLDKFLNLEEKKVTADVLSAIYEQLKAKGEKRMKELHKENEEQNREQLMKDQPGENREEISNNITMFRKVLLSRRGDGVLQEKDDKKEGDRELEKEDSEKDKFNWCTVDIEFDHSLLAWHIATDILYYLDFDQKQTDEAILGKRKISKCLSNYMLYLLVVCPSMLPQGIGEIRYRDTCAQVTRFYKRLPEREKPTPKDKSAFCKLLYYRIGRRPVNQSVLSDGCKLAHQLLKEIKLEDRWTIIHEVWIEILAYVASHCGWREHAQQLRKGGELLTHVCVLMANLGLSEQYV